MLRIIPFLFLVLCGPVLGGPQTNFHGNMTDQELFWGTDQYDFSVVVPAAGLECFWHFAHRGERFYLSFMVQWVTGVGHDRHVSVTMCFSNFHNRFGTMQVFLSFGVYYDGYKDPDKTKEEKKKEEASKDLNNTLRFLPSGFYRMCLGNHNHFGAIRVFVNFGVIYEGFEETKMETEEGEIVLNNTLAGIEESVQKLQNQIFHILFKTNSGGPRC
ncbi:hypothetical protein CesoFtcFv8_006973 [Champsocephalus esox]|uniref:GOLD domain-containing protein n=1 Tax=Champsocephalus esox TaxID=159716 RepID=A0AAN8H414_9TELE|nr:hypothetical protein CesoFtcFv8_006973 [Champsocephalus esox]